jgi:hypothetical protein
MTMARIAPLALIASVVLALPALAQNWPSNVRAPAAAGPGQFPPANAPAPAAAGPGQFPPANAPTALPAQPGSVPPPSQWGSNAPQHPAWGGGGAARPGAMAGGGGAPPCFEETAPMRDDFQKKGMALKAVIDSKKNDRKELCNAFRGLVTSEAKYVKFVRENAQRCSIPDNLIKDMRDNHGKHTTITNRVCNAAAGPSAPPPPSLSDALGTSRIPDSSNVKTGKGGTFDTLGGSAITR